MLFYYEVEVYEDDLINYGGFFHANSFSEAAQQLELFWGDTLNAIIKLAPYDCSFFAVPVEVARKIQKEVGEHL